MLNFPFSIVIWLPKIHHDYMCGSHLASMFCSIYLFLYLLATRYLWFISHTKIVPFYLLIFWHSPDHCGTGWYRAELLNQASDRWHVWADVYYNRSVHTNNYKHRNNNENFIGASGLLTLLFPIIAASSSYLGTISWIQLARSFPWSALALQSAKEAFFTAPFL